MDQSAFIFRVVVVTLAAVLVSVVLVMLAGLFDPKVDNAAVFDLLKPAFNMIIGAFVGVLGGRELAKQETK